MKILYFSLDYTPHDHRFLSALAETEHTVFYLRLQRGLRQTEDKPVPANIEQIVWPGGRGEFRWSDVPLLTSSLKQILHKVKPDLVHAGPIQTCAFITILTGFRPTLTMSWGFDLMEDAYRNRCWKWVTGYTLKRSTFFTSDAEVTRQRAIEFGMNPERIVVFPWGVDLHHFSPDVSRETESEDRSLTLFCNRSWEPCYGIDVLIKAFIAICKKQDDIRLLLLGDGSQAAFIRQVLEREGISDRVVFAGTINSTNLPRWYRSADLYISPSHVDGSSVSLMEALACGIPCLVSDIPANKEWVSEGKNGWLFPDGDSNALAAKVLHIYEMRRSLDKVCAAARVTAEEKADWKKNFSTLLNTYQRMVSAHA
ncbi:MAG: glycosyltransferase family 4 protein [Chloroflexota bacterium]